eukprot:scaffold748_cov176-Ochromonas_danica.AAC.3
MGFSDFFISVETLPENGYGFVQLLFLGAVYGYGLTYASNLISDGSELLLLVPAWAGLIGSVVLPVLGAVPDGCIVFFSGMGPNAQEQLNVGVGALAGSTIMLLTIPWFLSVIGGRVNIDPATGKPNYKPPKLSPPDYFHLTETGVSVSSAVNNGAYVVLLTAVPGLVYLNAEPEEQAAGEKRWAQLGAVACLIFFLGYLYQQYKLSQENLVQKRTREQYLRQAILNKKITLAGVMIAELEAFKLLEPSKSVSANGSYQLEAREQSRLLAKSSSQNLIEKGVPEDFIEHLERILKPFYAYYDENGDGVLNKDELVAVFRELGEDLSADEVKTLFAEFDTDNSGSVEYPEFVAGVTKYIVDHREIRQRHLLRRRSTSSEGSRVREALKATTDDDDNEEEDEVPDDMKNLSPEEQQNRIKLRSAIMMGIGTIIVLLVSDPMVDVMSELGKRTGIPAFYIAFVLAPLASNASELIASYNYALKKTPTTISISMATLEGAAVMNNTFVLGIFMLLICTQSLVWEFFAETLSILLVEVVIAIFALKKTHTILDAFLILSLYPLSLGFVAGLEAMGWN